MSWVILESVSLGPDLHIVPAEQQGTLAEHESSVACWCMPRTESSEWRIGPRIWLHRRTSDHGHVYRDDEDARVFDPATDNYPLPEITTYGPDSVALKDGAA